MKKRIIADEIFYVSECINKYIESRNYTWGEVKKLLASKNIQLQDDDVLEIGYDPGFFEEDNSSDPCHYARVIRYREETDEEFEITKAAFEIVKERTKKERFETYQKLKKEFETNNT